MCHPFRIALSLLAISFTCVVGQAATPPVSTPPEAAGIGEWTTDRAQGSDGCGPRAQHRQ